MTDSLQYLPPEKWVDLQDVFKLDSPRSLSGYCLLETQKQWLQQGFNSKFSVYCPYGDMTSGMVAIIEEAKFSNITIQCPRDDTEKLEDAIKKSKIIDWSKPTILPALPDHVLDCVKRLSTHLGVAKTEILPSDEFMLDKTSPTFVDISLPPKITFRLLSPEHVEFVDSLWPHRYPSSNWHFDKLIKSKNGYGLFIENVLIAWIFVCDAGALSHLYVLEEHRRKGYAELITKIVCNIILTQGRDVFVYTLKDNIRPRNLFIKLGFKNMVDVTWVICNNIENHKSEL